MFVVVSYLAVVIHLDVLVLVIVIYLVIPCCYLPCFLFLGEQLAAAAAGRNVVLLAVHVECCFPHVLLRTAVLGSAAGHTSYLFLLPC